MYCNNCKTFTSYFPEYDFETYSIYKCQICGKEIKIDKEKTCNKNKINV